MNTRNDTPQGQHPETDTASDPRSPTAPPDPRAGIDREVGDIEDADADDNDDALPGRAGGGLAGG